MNRIELIPLAQPIQAVVTIPSSKSYTNRALLIAAMATTSVTIHNLLQSDDTDVMIQCLKKLGVRIKMEKNALVVYGNIFDIKDNTYVLDTNLSGITMRFLTAMAILTPGEKILTGKKTLCKRPIKDLVNSLKQLGARIEYLEKEGYPPIKISPTNLIGQHSLNIPATISSQYISSLLLISPLLGGLDLNLVGNIVSKPYITMTIDTMRHFGVSVKEKNNLLSIPKNQQYKAADYTVEGDISSACYFAAIAVLTKSTITIKNCNPQSKQADMEFLSILQNMGNTISFQENSITITGKNILPISVDMTNCPDQIPTMAVLASFAEGKTVITGIKTLRLKETDRVAATQHELAKMGIKTTATSNVLTIIGGNPRSAIIDTYDDHRMAMSFAVAGCKLAGMNINNPGVVSKTFPTFFTTLESIGIKIKKPSTTEIGKIVIIGFMGVGKTSIAPLLAKRLKRSHIEMDDLILKLSGEKTIQAIFTQYGEYNHDKAFRTLELKVAQTLTNKTTTVISTGGGVVMNKKIMQHLKHNGTTILLTARFETIKERLAKHEEARPLFKEQSAESIYNKRLQLYKRYADIAISTDDKSLTKIADEIVVALGGKL